MRPDAYLGIDIGTSGLKVALVGEDGVLLSSAGVDYEIATPGPGRAESDPATWVSATTAAVARIGDHLGRVTVRAIGLAGQMHGAVLCDHAGTPVAPAILWPDRRATGELGRWRELTPSLRSALANPLVPGMTGPMVAWLAANRPEVVDRAAVVVQPKDAVRHAILDRPAAPVPVGDRSDASATLLWDVAADRWSTEVAAAAGVPSRLLPDVVRSGAVVGHTDWLARLVPGASTDVPVVAGAGDTAAALLATGATGLQLNFGTGAQALVPLREAVSPGAHPSTHLYADAGGHWYGMAALQNGGLALRWAATSLGMTWAEFVAAASRGDSGGVSFLPFLSGERGGVASPVSHGGWLGLGVETGRDDLARAAAEGVLFALRRCVDLLGASAVAGSEPVVLSGGGWRSAPFPELMAALLGRPVQRVDVRSASAVGAAMVAAMGVGQMLRPQRSVAEPLEPHQAEPLKAAYVRWSERSLAAEL